MRVGLWLFLAVLTGVASVRVIGARGFEEASIVGPEAFRPAHYRGL